VVAPQDAIRLRDGSYVEEAKKLQLEFIPDQGDDRFLLEEPRAGGGERGGPGGGDVPRPAKPKGFR
jgi:hypothetical protein